MTEKQLIIADAKSQAKMFAESYFLRYKRRLEQTRPYSIHLESTRIVVEDAAESSFGNLDCDASFSQAYVQAYQTAAYAWKPTKAAKRLAAR